MGISHTLFRRFFWSENILWKEGIRNRRVTVVLGGKDLIVDTEVVKEYLIDNESVSREEESWKGRVQKGGVRSGNELDVLWSLELDHGQMFNKKSMRARLVNIIRNYCHSDS
jgi:hypothetical protein